MAKKMEKMMVTATTATEGGGGRRLSQQQWRRQVTDVPNWQSPVTGADDQLSSSSEALSAKGCIGVPTHQAGNRII